MASDVKKSPATVFRSGLNGVQKQFLKNWETGKELFSFVFKIMKISISLVTISFSKSNLFLMEFLFK